MLSIILWTIGWRRGWKGRVFIPSIMGGFAAFALAASGASIEENLEPYVVAALVELIPLIWMATHDRRLQTTASVHDLELERQAPETFLHNT